MTKEIKLYSFLCSLFCIIIITSNLIFKKFINFTIFDHSFDITVGVLLYPITFLISDLVSEFYGKIYATFMVKISVACSIIIFILIDIADVIPANDWSVVNDSIFHLVFGAYTIAAISSIIANYAGQTIDIIVFLKLKRILDCKYLGIRNVVSTFLGLSVDATIITILLAIFGLIEAEHFQNVVFGGIIFKIIATIISVPIYYLLYFVIKKLIRKNYE